MTIARAGELGRGDRGNNANGDRIHLLTLHTPHAPVPPADINADLNLYTFVPEAIWISSENILGADYGAYVAPRFGHNNLGTDLSISDARVRNSTFGMGDLYAESVRLDWAKEHWEFAIDSGSRDRSYDARTATFPDGTEAPLESRDNFEPGYWEQQRARAAVAWYPMTNKATSFTVVVQLDHGNDYFDVRPGQLFTVSCAVNQFLPLRKDRELLLEVGPAGYDTCQITDSTGSNALTDAPRSHVHALGGELGLVYVPWNAFLTFQSFYESAADSRFQGASVGLNLGFKF